MARATITITDDDEKGAVSLSIDFDPPVSEANDASTAQYLGLRLMELATELSKE